MEPEGFGDDYGSEYCWDLDSSCGTSYALTSNPNSVPVPVKGYVERVLDGSIKGVRGLLKKLNLKQ